MRTALALVARPCVAIALLSAAILTAHGFSATPAAAATPPLAGIGRVVAPLVAHVEATTAGPLRQEQAPQEQAPQEQARQEEAQEQETRQEQEQEEAQQQETQQEQEQELPPTLDPASGPVFSLLGGSVFSGASAFQAGAAFAYFFGDKANIGVEVEGDITFGPGGRVAQAMGSFIYQTGARTSKFVPFFAIGGGYLRATSEYPSETQDVLDRFGIDPQPRTEEGPFFQYGGGVRYYVKPRVAFRADARFALVPLNLEEDTGLWDRMFGMSRIVGMLSFDF